MTQGRIFSLLTMLFTAILLQFALVKVASATPEIGIGDETAAPGETVSVPVSLANNGAPVITGLQIDILYPPEILTPSDPAVKAGQAATGADKNVVSNVIAEGRLRVVIAGLNVTPISDGVLFSVKFDVNQNATEGTVASLTPESVQATDANADLVPIDFSQGGGSITIIGAQLELSIGTASGAPGSTGVPLPISIASNDDAQPVGVQLDIIYDPILLTATGAEKGAAAEQAGKDVFFNVIEEGRARLLIAGINRNVIGDGIIAYILFDVANKPNMPDFIEVNGDAAKVVNAESNFIPTSVSPGGIVTCQRGDLNCDGNVDVVDAQIMINIILGIDPCRPAADLNDDGECDIADFPILVDIILGQ